MNSFILSKNSLRKWNPCQIFCHKAPFAFRLSLSFILFIFFIFYLFICVCVFPSLPSLPPLPTPFSFHAFPSLHIPSLPLPLLFPIPPRRPYRIADLLWCNILPEGELLSQATLHATWQPLHLHGMHDWSPWLRVISPMTKPFRITVCYDSQFTAAGQVGECPISWWWLPGTSDAAKERAGTDRFPRPRVIFRFSFELRCKESFSLFLYPYVGQVEGMCVCEK